MRHVKGIGIVEQSGAKVCSKREFDLRLARVYGSANDAASFTRLLIESRVSQSKLKEAFTAGKLQRWVNNLWNS